jgi:DNA-binding CsgD family transcriptional regulator
VSWSTLPPDIRDVAERELSPRQLEVLRLHSADWSIRRIARALDIAPSTVQGHLQRARQKITLALERKAAA